MSTNLWPMLIRILFPVPASFLFLVCLPLPSLGRKSITRWVLKFYDRIFTFRIVFPVIYLIIGMSTLLFLALSMETYNFREREMEAVDYHEKMSLRGRRWRAERNFYISFMLLMCSVLANKIRLMLKEMQSLRARIEEMKTN